MQSKWHFIADLHTHTYHSDGKGTVLQNALAAKRAGLSLVGITDHGGASIGLGVKSQQWKSIRDEVRQAELKTGIGVLFGCEANVISLDGTLDVPLSLRKSMDIVLAGLHPMVYPKTVGDGLRLMLNNLAFAKISKAMKKNARRDNTKALVEAVYKNRIDIITHPGLKLDVDTQELAKACAARETALEISAGHPYMTREFVEIAKKQGVMFAIGSDAHLPENVGKLLPGERIARLGGLNAEHIINVVEVGEQATTKFGTRINRKIDGLIEALSRKGKAT